MGFWIVFDLHCACVFVFARQMVFTIVCSVDLSWQCIDIISKMNLCCFVLHSQIRILVCYYARKKRYIYLWESWSIIGKSSIWFDFFLFIFLILNSAYFVRSVYWLAFRYCGRGFGKVKNMFRFDFYIFNEQKHNQGTYVPMLPPHLLECLQVSFYTLTLVVQIDRLLFCSRQCRLSQAYMRLVSRHCPKNRTSYMQHNVHRCSTFCFVSFRCVCSVNTALNRSLSSRGTSAASAYKKKIIFLN